jgi:hypothetical protein
MPIHLDVEDRRRLEALAAKWELSLAGAVRRAIKQAAEKEKV